MTLWHHLFSNFSSKVFSKPVSVAQTKYSRKAKLFNLSKKLGYRRTASHMIQSAFTNRPLKAGLKCWSLFVKEQTPIAIHTSNYLYICQWVLNIGYLIRPFCPALHTCDPKLPWDHENCTAQPFRVFFLPWLRYRGWQIDVVTDLCFSPVVCYGEKSAKDEWLKSVRCWPGGWGRGWRW